MRRETLLLRQFGHVLTTKGKSSGTNVSVTYRLRHTLTNWLISPTIIINFLLLSFDLGFVGPDIYIQSQSVRINTMDKKIGSIGLLHYINAWVDIRKGIRNQTLLYSIACGFEKQKWSAVSQLAGGLLYFFVRLLSKVGHKKEETV